MSEEVRFARRTGWQTEESAWARALAGRRRAGLPVLDLTASNPASAGFLYPPGLLAELTRPEVLGYEPDPRGLRAAREAVAGYYAGCGAEVSPERILLTASTSEAYSYLLRLLAEPGDQVLVARPSYPLLDYLAEIGDVRLTAFELVYDHGWQIDFSDLEQRIGEARGRARALVLVNPNNPTGQFVRPAERRRAAELCARHGMALIVDEVFLDYPLEGEGASFAADAGVALTFVLSGLSKVAALPQMKLGWMAVLGAQAEEALARLEVIADTYLSVSAPVQFAAPAWLAGAGRVREQIRARTGQNLRRLDRMLAEASPGLVSRLRVEAGWMAVLRVPALGPDTGLALQLAAEGVAVHPGSFYGFPPSGWLVVSLLGRPAEFAAGGEILLGRVAAGA